jgi:hypothetical protein
VGEKNYFLAQANSYELKLNDYARSLLVGVDPHRFLKPKSRIKFESLLAMTKGTIRDLRNWGHDVDFYLPSLDSLELLVQRAAQIKRKPIEFVVDKSPAMLHLHFSESEIAQIDCQARQNHQSRNDYIRLTLKSRSLPAFQVAEVNDEALEQLFRIWSQLREFKYQVLFGT